MSSEVRKSISGLDKELVLYPQPEKYGCIYYSFASLVNDDWWINRRYTSECSYNRFIPRAFKEGYQMIPWYKNYYEKASPGYISRDLHHFSRILNKGEHISLHLTIDSLKYKDTRHCVGLQIINTTSDEYGELKLGVLDPGREKPLVFTREEFEESPYSQCWEIWQAFKGSYTKFDSQFGPNIRQPVPKEI